MNPRVAVYLRVSTDAQTHESQRRELAEYCTCRGWDRVNWIPDTASGAKQNRNGLNGLMDSVRRGKLDVVLTYKLDRLARSLTHLAHLIGEFQSNRVALVVPSQGIDTSESSPCAQLQLNILGAVAQFEWELITERVRAGIKAAKERGVKLGRPAKSHRYIEQVKEMMGAGLKAAEIARRLEIPYSSASELVRNITAEKVSRGEQSF